MASNFMANVPENFNLDALAGALCQQYQAKGFSVHTVSMNNAIKLTFDKGCGGINMLLGLGLGISATLTLNGNTLMVSYGEEEWTGKIIGLVVGWFLCLIPFITAIIGTVKQLSLSKELSNDVQMLINQ